MIPWPVNDEFIRIKWLSETKMHLEENYMKKYCGLTILLAALTTFTLVRPAVSAAEIELTKGQTCYVPAYSHIYGGNRERLVLLAVTLSIRNTDAKNAITVTSVEYFGTQGELLRQYLENPLNLRPFESTRYVVPQKDKSGGSGANFVVKWKSEKPANQPIIESVMIGVEGQQGISFTSRGQAISTDS